MATNLNFTDSGTLDAVIALESVTEPISEVEQPITVVEITSVSSLLVGVPLTVRGTAWGDPGTITKVEIQMGATGPFLASPISPGNWSNWSFTTTPTVAGPVRITAVATSQWNFGTLTRTQTGTTFIDVQMAPDTIAPTLNITEPTETAIPGDETGADVTIKGTASDAHSGLQRVEYSLDGGPFQPATPVGSWATWSAPVRIPAINEHTVTVRAWDMSGNSSTKSIKLTVLLPFRAADVQNNTSPLGYLKNLIEFAKSHLSITEAAQTRFVQTDDLRREFLQPFDAIRTDEPVHQIRLAVEGLRKYLASTADTVWVDDSVPAGAQSGGNSEGWNWVTANPTPLLSNAVHQSNIVSGLHQHFFGGALQTLTINPGDKLFAYVFLDPANPPSEVMLQWFDFEWEHRAFWGADLVNFGATGTTSRRNMGALPPVGKWVRLEVPASAVGLEGKTINGMAFTLFNGRATFGRTGKTAETPQLVAHWKFDEAAGSTIIADATGNGSTGTVPPAITLVPGRSGNALSFNGASSSVVPVVSRPALTSVTNNFTVAFWAKPEATTASTVESTTGTGGLGGGHRYVIGPQQGAQAFGSAAHSGAGVSVGTNGVTVVDHTDFTIPPLLVYQAPISGWTHVAVVFENKTPRLYLNGRLVRTGLQSPRSFVHIFPKDIGGMVYGFYQGQLDDLRIYNKPLTAWEIDAICQAKQTATPLADLSIAETAYMQSAYQVMLNKLGTSYEEMRLARTADPAARTALAQRIGIDLTKLDSLFLDMSQVTEEKLEKLFGLVDTTRSPLVPADVPSLLIWQRDHLRTLWKLADHPGGSEGASLPPIVDPDVIGEEFLIKSTQSTAYSLWQQRKALISNQMSLLAADKPPAETALARFDRLVTAKVAPIADLLALDAHRKQGKDILPDLEEIELTLPAFSYLIRMRNLVVESTLLDSEWNDIYSILTQVWKVQNYTDWKAAEADLILGPESFTIPAAGAQSALPAWRATEQARRKWVNTLQARIDQDQALQQALQTAVSATEEATLPALRDALITAINATISLKDYRTDAEIANAITEWLAIDVSGSGFQQTTRINQAIETLQGILFSLRTENFKTIDTFVDPRLSSSRSKWKLAVTNKDFDDEWLWMASYSNWQAATLIFLYPENALVPTLRDNATTAFRELAASLRNTPSLTSQQARILADQYLTKVRANVSGLPADFKITETNDHIALRTLNQGLFSSFVDQAPVPHLRTQPPPVHLEEIFFAVPMQIALRLQQARQFTAALDWFRLIYDYNLPVANRKVYYGLELEHNTATTYDRTLQWLRDWLNPYTIARKTRADAYTRFTLMSIARCMLEYADSEFTTDSNESVPRARILYMNALDVLNLPEFAPPPASTAVAPNAVPQNLRLHAEINLFKLRNGRNIAGMRRQLEPYGGSQNQTSTALSITGAPAPATQLQPTPYRFSALVDRAKQLVSIAQQIEAAYLAALEKLDAENYSLLKARQDLSLSTATVELQDLRVTEAFDGIGLAQAQISRSQLQLDHYTDLIDQGQSGWENAALGFHAAAATFSAVGAVYNFGAAVSSTFSLSTAFDSGSNVFKSLAAASSSLASAASSSASAASTIASYERRKQEWELQKSLAVVDVAIGNQQKLMADQRYQIADKERSISTTQMSNAQATVNFLATKFTNADLYEFMSGVLQGVYSYFLQQATATARLAQNQLSFERQEAPVSFIQSDYWQPPSDGASSGSNSQATDRRGMTGSARLLRDIYQLDQYAFDTNKRKLQLTKVISLAQLAPVEFQRFRETGVMRFGTSMELFDRDFPGHYLRLISRVSTTVIALIPPVQGIRATLSTTGVSRVTIGGDNFQTAVIRRAPEMVALTSPTNATGLFELQQQSDMLLPFEAMGVDTSWEFQMPKPANPFDYNSVADVLISIDYTALSDVDYRQQVIRSLNRDLSAERAFSLRRRIAEWYDLNNPSSTATEIITSMKVKREDFAPNIDNLSLKHLTLFVARADGESFELPMSLRFTPEGGQEISLTEIITEQGMISTRRNGSGWAQFISGNTPQGVWKIVLPNTPEVRSKFQNEKVEDILLVLTYNHRTAGWPA
ncbi:MAG TPA: LamG-like jellyroll fold domain-containing protein [Pyrinomonadaceae bacterium]|nr:LamG-like jellyroll fold domain-containing protein [Pyrinomonadaceae bacterium]